MQSVSTTETLQNDLLEAFESIIDYWKNNSIDETNGGFVGQRNFYNELVPNAHKGIILNARLLWTFSAIGNFNEAYKTAPLADRAFHYLQAYFQDTKNGGVFWELDATGQPVNTRKQIYAQAFTIYALSEYYLLSGNKQAKDWALSIFQLIEQHAFDKTKNGYVEAFAADWASIDDMRLSEKDLNAAKTMNTHLHILEAYTTLFQVTQKEVVRQQLENLIGLFLDKFYNRNNQHFRLFFDEEWKHLDTNASFGHDIETIWLLVEAAKATNNLALIERTQAICEPVSTTFITEAFSQDGAIINEKNLKTHELDTDRHWWPQVEAMVGLYYTYSITQKMDFLQPIYAIWEYTKSHIIDHQNGEWFFRVDAQNKPYTNEDKLSMWKCPYHNSRACMILLTLIK